jgi:hypothetical protein
MNTKSLTKRLALAFTVAGALTFTAPAQAQDIYYMVNFYPVWGNSSALYASWADWPANPSEVNMTWLYTGNFATSGL